MAKLISMFSKNSSNKSWQPGRPRESEKEKGEGKQMVGEGAPGVGFLPSGG